MTSSLVTPKKFKGLLKDSKKEVILSPKKYISLEAKKF